MLENANWMDAHRDDHLVDADGLAAAMRGDGPQTWTAKGPRLMRARDLLQPVS